jgi:putative FmdB family regulatory protein
MPVYEYRCHQCNKVFEFQQRMADAAKTTCEECSGQLERLISRSSFSFKGGGWYKDLYSSAPKADAPASRGEAKADAPKTESAPAKTESAPAKTESSGSGTGTGSGGAGGAGGSAAAAAPAK